jgi:hypothetical protein
MKRTSPPVVKKGVLRLGLAAALAWTLACSVANVQAQTFTNSPYSSLGVGDLFNQSLTRQWGMGGAGIASFDYLNNNRLNPANLADISLTTFDVYGLYNSARLANTQSVYNYRSGTLGGLALSFPTRAKFNFAFGLAPYSNVGYQVNDSIPSPDPTVPGKYPTSNQSEGGLSEVYVGVARKLLKKKVAVGAHINYIFGNISEQWVTQTPDLTSRVTISRNSTIGAPAFAFGVTYTDTLFKKWLGRVGVTAKLPVTLNINQRRQVLTEAFNSQFGQFIALGSDTLSSVRFNTSVIPAKYGIGFGLEQFAKLMIVADFTYQDWRTFSFPARDQGLKEAWRFATGVEWIPQANGLKYYKRIAYRAGFTYENTYIQRNGTPVQNMMLTVSFGMPLFRQYSRFNFGGGIGRRGTLNNGLIQEDYFQIMAGLTFNEIWFFKRTYD